MSTNKHYVFLGALYVLGLVLVSIGKIERDFFFGILVIPVVLGLLGIEVERLKKRVKSLENQLSASAADED